MIILKFYSFNSFFLSDAIQNLKREHWYVVKYNHVNVSYKSVCPDIPGVSGSGLKSEDEDMEVEVKTKKAGQKRGSDQSAASSPKKKPAVNQSGTTPSKEGRKPLCKYGVKCYQKNREHLDKFYHPWVCVYVSTYTYWFKYILLKFIKYTL